MTRLWHYTCTHGINGIVKARGTLKPNQMTGFQPKVAARFRELFGEDQDMHAYVWPVVWVTDVDVQTRGDACLLGLGQLEGNLTDCFRIEFRFRVPNVGLVPWKQWADEHVLPGEPRKLLESAAGCDPTRWWVSDKPITGCALDTRYHAVRAEATP